MSEDLVFRLNLKNEEWSSYYEPFKESLEDQKKNNKLFLRTHSAYNGSKAFFFMEYNTNISKLSNVENEEFSESFELCSFDFTKCTMEFYGVPNQKELFPLKKDHVLLFNQNSQLFFLDSERFHRYDFIKKELTKINKGVVLSPADDWKLLDFGFLNKNLYKLCKEDNKIKLFFIGENELNEMKMTDENISLYVISLLNKIFVYFFSK